MTNLEERYPEIFSRLVTDEELELITEKQKATFAKFLAVNPDGDYFEYQGKRFITYPGVFRPFGDSEALATSFKINPGETVLDMGCGTGVLAILALYRGASRAVAVDINPEAVRATKKNAELHMFGEQIEARVSDAFAVIAADEQFDVIFANLPFRDRQAKNLVEASMWDTDRSFQRNFFASVKEHLAEGGRIYFNHGNFGTVREMLASAEANGFTVRIIGKHAAGGDDPRVFFAFELMNGSAVLQR